MKYHQNILDRLRDPNNWLQFHRPQFLQELNDLADDAFRKRTIEGYLASLLIYHQLCEEMMKLLIECSSFYLQLRIFPQKLKPRDLKGKMFGELIRELGYSVLDKDIESFIEKCKELNSLRIKMVHKITLKTSIEDISRQCRKAQQLFNSIRALFVTIHDSYRVNFSHYEKDIDDLKELLER
jgi:hypothetical protein